MAELTAQYLPDKKEVVLKRGDEVRAIFDCRDEKHARYIAGYFDARWLS